MNGYSCPCCDGFIARAFPGEMRPCPTCKAQPSKQRLIARARQQEQSHEA